MPHPPAVHPPCAAALLAVGLAVGLALVSADLDARCNSGWQNRDNRAIDRGTDSPLSQCQVRG